MKKRHVTWLNSDDIQPLISIPESISIIENAFAQYAQGKSRMPAKVYLPLPEYKGDFRAMPAYDATYNIAGIKWVNSHQNNGKKGIPSVMATIILNDPETAEPLAIMDGTYITALRTSAAGAVAIKYMTAKTASTVSLIGAGCEAIHHIKAAFHVRPITQINIVDPSASAIDTLIKAIGDDYKGTITVHETIQHCVKETDIIITTTPSQSPIIKDDWIPNHVHINAIGADAKGKQECEPTILTHSQVIVDDIQQASHSGEINVPLTSNHYKASSIKGTLGQLILDEINIDIASKTLFDSTGLAIQDMAMAGAVLSRFNSQ